MFSKQFVQKQIKKICTLSFCMSLMTVSLLSFNETLNALPAHLQRENAQELGLALETKFWAAVQNGNVKRFSKMISPSFQGIDISGVFNRQNYISNLDKALSNVSLQNMLVKQSKDVLVISYDFFGTGPNVTEGPTVDVWKKHCGVWKLESTGFVPFP